MEVAQASIAIRVPSLTDLSLNAAGALAGAVAGSAWHVLGARMTPRANPRGRGGAVALSVLVLWLIARLWPLVPDASLRQLKRAVRPLFSPETRLAGRGGILRRLAGRRTGRASTWRAGSAASTHCCS